jgi:hypothetical protein
MTRAYNTATTQQNTGGAVPAFIAGKNAIINGDFFVNQRSFTTTTTSGTYGLDRFKYFYTGGTSTYSVQQFTPGAAPVSGYEATQYARLVTTGQSAAGDYTFLTQVSENPRLFAGQTITFSFWAKAASGTPKVSFEFTQYFGTGGSPSSTVNTYGGQATLSTSWARYSITFAVPSVSGKTFGTTANTAFTQMVMWVSAGSTYDSRTGTIGIQSNTFDIWGVQWEAGSSATDFQTASGSIGGELALCQRYYWRNGGLYTYQTLGMGIAQGTTLVNFVIPNPVTMRKPSSNAGEYSTIAAFNGAAFATPSALSFSVGGNFTRIEFTTTGVVTGTPYELITNNSTSAYLAVIAEL